MTRDRQDNFEKVKIMAENFSNSRSKYIKFINK
jgi:hypothetical protein